MAGEAKAENALGCTRAGDGGGGEMATPEAPPVASAMGGVVGGRTCGEGGCQPDASRGRDPMERRNL